MKKDSEGGGAGRGARCVRGWFALTLSGVSQTRPMRREICGPARFSCSTLKAAELASILGSKSGGKLSPKNVPKQEWADFRVGQIPRETASGGFMSFMRPLYLRGWVKNGPTLRQFFAHAPALLNSSIHPRLNRYFRQPIRPKAAAKRPAQDRRFTPKHAKDPKVRWGPRNTRTTRKMIPSEDRTLSSQPSAQCMRLTTKYTKYTKEGGPRNTGRSEDRAYSSQLRA